MSDCALAAREYVSSCREGAARFGRMRSAARRCAASPPLLHVMMLERPRARALFSLPRSLAGSNPARAALVAPSGYQRALARLVGVCARLFVCLPLPRDESVKERTGGAAEKGRRQRPARGPSLSSLSASTAWAQSAAAARASAWLHLRAAAARRSARLAPFAATRSLAAPAAAQPVAMRRLRRSLLLPLPLPRTRSGRFFFLARRTPLCAGVCLTAQHTPFKEGALARARHRACAWHAAP